MKEERQVSKQVPSEVLSWVTKSRKLEKHKEQALQRSQLIEERDNNYEEEKEEDLAGVKILHGLLDKVIEGGAVVKDQNILADGDINEDADMLENIEIGEQKMRDEAYKAANKKTNVYEDKQFNGDPGLERKILPQYDDVVGRFSGQAERRNLKSFAKEALEAEAVAAGLGEEDLGSRKNKRGHIYGEMNKRNLKQK
ncbi:hypothetical protein QQ045_001241 [Rhodiola kirilowii]